MFARIDRYVLREVAVSLAAVTTVLLAILASYQVARILGVAAERGFPHDVVLGLIGLTTLENLMVLVPISMLLAVMLALGRLFHESEMAAARACGIGPERLYLPVFALALPLALALAWLTFLIGPAARDAAEELRGRGMRDAQFGLLQAGTFRTYSDGKAVFFAEEKSADGRLDQCLRAALRRRSRGGRNRGLGRAARAGRRPHAAGRAARRRANRGRAGPGEFPAHPFPRARDSAGRAAARQPGGRSRSAGRRAN